MIQLLLIRDSIRKIIKKHSAIVIPAFRFIVAFTIFIIINTNMGYNEKIKGITVLVLFSAISAFFPMGVTVLLACTLVILHIYSASIFLAAIFILIITVLYLMLMRFASKYSYFVLAIPIFAYFNCKSFIPIVAGLTTTPVALFAIIPGIITSILFTIVKEAVKMSSGTVQLEDNLQTYVFIIRSLLENKLLILTIVAAICVFFATYVCRRLAISHAYLLGIIVGMITNLIIMIIGSLIFDVDVSILWTLLGTLLSGAFAYVVQFFKYILDYSSVEHIQFDDDEYHYYVTAVPKLSVTSPDLNVLKISGDSKEKEIHNGSN